MTNWPTLLRRLALWTIVCALSAAPSFWLARSAGADAAGMVAGVALFVLTYTIATSTNRFERIYRRPFVRDTMRVGYGLRLILSGLVLLAAFGPPANFAVAPDLIVGVLSVNLTSRVGLGIEAATRGGTVAAPSPFLAAFVTTCVQGALLNVIVFVVMAVAYVGQRLFRKPPADDDRHRGFEVLPAAEAR